MAINISFSILILYASVSDSLLYLNIMTDLVCKVINDWRQMPKLLALQHRYCAITYHLRYVDIPYVPVPSNIELLRIV